MKNIHFLSLKANDLKSLGPIKITIYYYSFNLSNAQVVLSVLKSFPNVKAPNKKFNI